ELKKGLSWHAAIEEGFHRAWPSIRDSNISTIITSAILYFFTSSFVQGFALTLGLGVIISMFSAISVTRTMLEVFIKK
ncbi:MMPL family transporter, partial [Patescibacteria group bacterium]|nr:MMPL family transporter [Patescibacteria group bacterium]